VARRTRLRTRVLLLTAAFAIALFAITFGLSWRAQVAQERWSRLVGVETRAIGTLEELIRAQNAYHAHATLGSAANYRIVSQLLESDSLRTIDIAVLRHRMSTFTAVLADATSTPREIDTESQRVVAEAQRIIDERKREIARQLPMLERENARADVGRPGHRLDHHHLLLRRGAGDAAQGGPSHRRPLPRCRPDRLRRPRRARSGGRRFRSGPPRRRRQSHGRRAESPRENRRADVAPQLPRLPRAHRSRNRTRRTLPERFGILILDLDRFKKYNDTYGHLAGNDALQRVARAIREAVRAVDFPARYGGEEFAVILPQLDAPALAAIAERIRASIEAMPAPSDGAQVTVSIGAAMYPDDGKVSDSLFRAADERLYAAKEGGRNRVVGVAALNAWSVR